MAATNAQTRIPLAEAEAAGQGCGVTPAQRAAFKHSCRLAGECVNPVFHNVRGLYSVNLTLNSGYE